MIKLRDSQIAQILPDKLAEIPEVQALSFAISEGMKRFVDYCANISVYAEIDNLPEYALDLLASELNTQYYDTELPIEAKRNLIKGTLVWYMSAGTPSAVSELVTAVFGEGEVKEWYEYGGDPYFFKIETNAYLTPDIIAQFAKMIQRVKNARSHIESVDIHRSLSAPVRLGVSCQMNNKITITNHMSGEEQIKVSAKSAAAQAASMRTVITNRPGNASV